MEERKRHFNATHAISNIFLFLSFVCFTCLIIAIHRGLPYDYFIFLRWLIFISAFFGISIFLIKGNFVGYLFFSGVAILFNPIFPIHSTKDVWIILDLLTAALFLISMLYVNNNPEYGDYLIKNRYIIGYCVFFMIVGLITSSLLTYMSYSTDYYYYEPEPEDMMKRDMIKDMTIRWVILGTLGAFGLFELFGNKGELDG